MIIAERKGFAFSGTRWPLAMLAVAGALVFAAVFRTSLADYSLWADELASVFFAQQPLGTLWSGWMVRETNPPLYYSILHGWIALVGLSSVKLRMLSIIAGLLAILVAYLAVGRTYGQRAGVIAALFLALSGQQLAFSLLVRSYIFLYLAISISFYGLLEIARSTEMSDRKLAWPWGAYVGGAVAGVYLHTTAVLWPLAGTVALMLADRRFRPFKGHRWITLGLADLLIVACSAWWLHITYLQLSVPNGNISWIVAPDARQTFSLFFSTILLTRDAFGWAKIIPLAIAGLALLCVVRTYDRSSTRLTLACPIVATLLFIVLGIRQPVIMDKTIFWLSIFPLTLAAGGLGMIASNRVFIPVTAAVLILLSFNLSQNTRNLQIEDWTTPLNKMAADPRSALLVDGESMGVTANIACDIELGKSPCPFPIITLVRNDDPADPWARGHSPPMTLDPSGQPVLPAHANIYLFRRNAHDVLTTLHRLGDLRSVPRTAPNFLGPYSQQQIHSVGQPPAPG